VWVCGWVCGCVCVWGGGGKEVLRDRQLTRPHGTAVEVVQVFHMPQHQPKCVHVHDCEARARKRPWR
jgi:hypothetical protein